MAALDETDPPPRFFFCAIFENKKNLREVGESLKISDGRRAKNASAAPLNA